jgi:hypothetical protein
MLLIIVIARSESKGRATWQSRNLSIIVWDCFVSLRQLADSLLAMTDVREIMSLLIVRKYVAELSRRSRSIQFLPQFCSAIESRNIYFVESF